MMLRLDGYRIERLLRSTSVSRVWAGTRERDGLAIVAKAYAVEHNLELRARVEHEFELIRSLDCPGVVRALALEHSGEDLVLVLEAHAGTDLRELARPRPLEAELFLDVATQLTRILAEVHERRVIHRDIKPTNILIDPQTRAVALADFGISVLLETERGQLRSPSVLTGTLPYMAPEQTGRSGLEVDFRSDLYSLGVTFYELLTGELPFQADSPLELIHAHFARRPTPPQRLRPTLPSALSALVMKLLEKAPEQRYQSARGLHADLVRLRELLGRGGPSEGFELGRDDASQVLQLPRQLYGRAREVEVLRGALERAAELAQVGHPQLVLVSGPTGTGKTALLDQLRVSVLERRGTFARGRGTQTNTQPLAPVLDALEHALAQLLTREVLELRAWRARLVEGLVGYLPVLRQLLPKLRTLLDAPDAQPRRRGEDSGSPTDEAAREDDTPEVDPSAARARVTQALLRLVELLVGPAHPLVLAIDDLQWADAATLEFLDTLAAQPLGAMVLIACSQEGGEHDKGVERGEGRLDRLRTTHEARGGAVFRLALGPLGHDDLCLLLSDLLSRPRAEVEALAAVVTRKTGRNPFFTRQFLVMLGELGLLARNADGWQWQLDALERAELPADAVDMMTAKLERLSDRRRELLQAACVLSQPFALERLDALIPLDGALGEIQALVEDGLLTPHESGGYTFVHDRVREATEASLEPDRLRSLHRHVAAAALERDVAPQRLEDRELFALADHLVVGHDLRPDAGPHAELTASGKDSLPGAAEALEQLVRLELHAAARALATGAPDTAWRYAAIARALLERMEPFPAAPGHPRRSLHFEVVLMHAQTTAARTQSRLEAEALFDALFDHGLTPAELGEFAVAQIWFMSLCDRRVEGLERGMDHLRTLGVPIPRRIHLGHVVPQLLRMKRILDRLDVEAYAARAPIQDPALLASVRIFHSLNTDAFLLEPNAFVLLNFRALDLHLRHGSSELALPILALVRLILGAALGRERETVAACEQILAVHERTGAPSQRVRVQLPTLWTSLWSVPFLELTQRYAVAVQGALAIGDVETARTAFAMRVDLSFAAGAHLRVVDQLAADYRRLVEQWGLTKMARMQLKIPLLTAILREGPIPAPGEVEIIEIEAQEVGVAGPLFEWSEQIMVCLVLGVFGRWAELRPRILDAGQALERAVRGSWFSHGIHILTGVACAQGALEATSQGERRRLRARLRRAERTLAKRVAKGGRFEFGHTLLQGELAALAGDFAGAARAFGSARAIASEDRNPIYEGLASERLASHASREGLDDYALASLRRARAAYLRWGAFAKVAQLDADRPELAEPSEPSEVAARPADDPTSLGATTSVGTTSRSDSNAALDAETLIAASQAIASDIVLDEVITRVLQLAAENAGAERGALLLAEDGRLRLTAEFAEGHTTLSRPAVPLDRESERLPNAVLRWVLRTGQALLLDDSQADLRFAADPYLARSRCASICLPIVKHSAVIGLIYLENQFTAGVFTPARLEPLRVLAGQAASALDNARLYADLRQSEARWRALVEQLPDLVALVRHTGALELTNDDALRRWREWIVREDQDQITAALKAVFKGEGPVEVDVHSRDEAPREFLVRVSPVALDGAIAYALLVATDVTERRRARRAKAELEAQVRQQQRLESIGTLASGVAHEIKNPMQGILNYAELIRDPDTPSKESLQLAGEIIHETERVAAIVRNLLAFSRRDLDEPPTPTAPAAIVDDTLSLLRAVLRKDDVALSVELEPELPRIDCRSQQIQQVLMNLVANARDALNARYPEGGPQKRIELRVRAHEGAVQFSVRDWGGGVPAEAVERIFDPFFTTKGRDEGTGLGLAVSHGIVAEHGGALHLDNEPGVGACFIVELPAMV